MATVKCFNDIMGGDDRPFCIDCDFYDSADTILADKKAGQRESWWGLCRKPFPHYITEENGFAQWLKVDQFDWCGSWQMTEGEDEKEPEK
jgi:hypothetical protein